MRFADDIRMVIVISQISCIERLQYILIYLFMGTPYCYKKSKTKLETWPIL